MSGFSGTGLVLQNNGDDYLVISGNGSFTFNSRIPHGTSYHVTVLTQPVSPAQTCTVTNASGIMQYPSVTNIGVSCVNTYTVGGTVVGVRGSRLVLQNNSGDNLAISADGGFTFSTAIASGENYSVSVATQPSSPSQTCTVTNGSGTVANADVTDVAIACETNTYLFYQKPTECGGSVRSDVADRNRAEGIGGQCEHGRACHLSSGALLFSCGSHYETIFYRRTASRTFWKVSALSGSGLTPVQCRTPATSRRSVSFGPSRITSI